MNHDTRRDRPRRRRRRQYTPPLREGEDVVVAEEREAKRLWKVFRSEYAAPLVPDDWCDIGISLRVAFRAMAKSVLRRGKRK